MLLPVIARAQQSVAIDPVHTDKTPPADVTRTDLPIAPAQPDLATKDPATGVVPSLTSIVRNDGLNRNQQQIAGALNDFVNRGGKLPPQFASLLKLTGSDLTKALTSLSGEAATAGQQVSFQLMRQFFGVMVDPFIDGGGGIGGATSFAPERTAMPEEAARAYASVLRAPPAGPREPQWSAWASGFGGHSHTSGDTVVGSNDLTTRLWGFAGGFDYHVTRDTVVGFALAGGNTNWDLAEGLGGGKSDAVLAGIHAATRSGPSYLSARFAYSWHHLSTDRFAVGDHLTADFNAQSLAARVESGWSFAVANSSVAPYGALQVQSVRTPSYSETDLNGGGFALAYQARTATDVRSELGARFEHRIMLDNNAKLTLGARAAWAHDWANDPSITAAFQALSTVSFTVNGAPLPKDSALGLVGAELRLPSGVTLSGKVDGEFASGATTWAGTGRIRYQW